MATPIERWDIDKLPKNILLTSATEYGKDCPPNTAFAVHGTIQGITRFRAEKVLACFATDYGKGK